VCPAKGAHTSGACLCTTMTPKGGCFSKGEGRAGGGTTGVWSVYSGTWEGAGCAKREGARRASRGQWGQRCCCCCRKQPHRRSFKFWQGWPSLHSVSGLLCASRWAVGPALCMLFGMQGLWCTWLQQVCMAGWVMGCGQAQLMSSQRPATFGMCARW
jgi:hypothetical protein